MTVKEIILKIKNIKIQKQFWVGLFLGIPFTILIAIIIAIIQDQIVRPIKLAGYYQRQEKEKQETLRTATNATATPLPILIKSSDIKWLDEPVKVAPLPVFKSNEELKVLYDTKYQGQKPWGGYEYNFNKSTFYKVGDLIDGSTLYKVFYKTNNNSTDLFYFKKFVNGDYEFIDFNSWGSRTNEEMVDILLDGVKLQSGRIEDLMVPNSFVFTTDYGRVVAKFSKSADYSAYRDLNDLENLKFLGISDSSNKETVYFTYTNSMPSERIFFLRMKDGTGVAYKLDDDIPYYDNRVAKVKWLDGEDNYSVYIEEFNKGGGCGMMAGKTGQEAIVIREGDLDINNDGERIGTTSEGDYIYKLRNSETVWLMDLYNNYKKTREGGTEWVVTYDEFIKDKSYFLWQDSRGDWHVFLNQKYTQLAECGKPVIYLYPEKELNVNVQVGAKITVSDPEYPKGGWNVLAKPNGEIIYHNNVYPYLFWEGFGLGIYPEVKNRGFVVKKNNIEQTLKDHLSKLGLNDRESKDFMEFWLPKMPNKPFVRLTWLNTHEMNSLAPLTVAPSPDTLIRVFLDFEGLDKEIKLIPQKLSAPERKGFALIEWGGLLVK